MTREGEARLGDSYIVLPSLLKDAYSDVRAACWFGCACTHTACAVPPQACTAFPGVYRYTRSLLPNTAALHLSRDLRASGVQLSTTVETGQETAELAQWVTAGGGVCECVQVAFTEEAGQTLVATQVNKRLQLFADKDQSTVAR